MKANQNTIDTISDQLSVALAYLNIEPKDVITGILRWQLWHWVHEEIAFTNDHPRFKDRIRQLPHDFNHKLYPDGTNDDTMNTALVVAFRKLAYKPIPLNMIETINDYDRRGGNVKYFPYTGKFSLNNGPIIEASVALNQMRVSIPTMQSPAMRGKLIG